MSLPPYHDEPEVSEPRREEPAAPEAPAPRRRRGLLVLLVAMVFLFATALVLFAIVSLVQEHEGGILADSVAVISVEGEILGSREFIETLHRYQDDGNVRGVVVRLDTPGGGITPSQEIYEEIIDFRTESGKPVIASMGSVAASGGYYIASACDHIVASKGTVTGSIGVIAQWMNLQNLLEWAKVDPKTFVSGERKDLGNPFREMTPEEEAFYQGFIQELHDQFVDAVADARGMDRAEVAKLADGRIYTGEGAVAVGLVDEIGSLWDAIEIAGEQAGIGRDPRVLYPRKREPGLIDLLFSSGTLEGRSVRDLIEGNRSPFMYRWR